MRKLVLLAVCFGVFQTIQAQDKKSEKKSETIILEDKEGTPNGTTIEIRNGEVYIDGKKVADDVQDKDKSVKIIKKRYLNGKEVPFDEEDNNVFSFPFDDMENSSNKPMLGVTFKNSDNNEGAVVESIVPKSPAEKMGILQGDIITKVDDKNIHNPKDLVDAIASYKPGDVVDITFERSNKMMTKKATLDKQSENMTFRRSMPFGDDLFDMNPMFKQFNTEMFRNSPNAAPSPKIGVSVEDRADGEGVLVEEVNENSAAAKSGIEKGDVITEFGSSSIHSVDELMDAIQQNQNKGKVDVTVKRKGVSKKMALTIPKNLKKKEL